MKLISDFIITLSSPIPRGLPLAWSRGCSDPRDAFKSHFLFVLDLFFTHFSETLYLPGKMHDCILLNISPEVAI